MTESFAQLFEESLKEIETRPGSIVRGVVVAIDKDVVLVDAGLKSESAIPAEQFKNAQGELEIQVGDEVDVALDAVEDGFGETLLSREKAKRHEAWITLEKAYEDAETVTGVINGKVKGGFTVELIALCAVFGFDNGTTRNNNVVALLIQLDYFKFKLFAFQVQSVTHRTNVYQRT
ncbi:S1 RNA-binding domain-containing protein, partial [Escherichia coli]